ncbi:hypothetical protein MPRF_49960 [Mycolicibacterium parafortuitum]|uniref:HTTM-like domain-containing protein n=1 Tax=Mycolicibacterium parafortuitum TaxID=39692 RepID=A0A7I7UA14_MYCPF|nr:hypothetical protein [Mycolicibacterium parafortuitum]BBY78097.1 hypothetical protein MPRF_49960 [Mycolicibacterium parafortuitum]
MYLDVAQADILQAYQLTSRIAGIALIISSLEEISLHRHFAAGGVYDLSRIDAALRRHGEDSRRRTIIERPALHVAWPVLRLAPAGALVLGPNTFAQMAICWVLVALTTIAVQERHRLGGEDGSDQLLAIMSIAFAISLVLGFCEGALVAGMLFVGAQSVLSYVTAGFAKLHCPVWRHGAAVYGVLATRSHGMRSVARIVERAPTLGYVLCWVTISFESSFVLAPILPLPLLVALLVVAAGFHATVAVVMGLNGFFWAFVSTYPAVIFLNETVRSCL